jgi:hypothetical protein
MRIRSLLGFAASIVLLGAVPGGAAAAEEAMAVVDKGPVGWDVYRRWDLMAAMRPGSQARQFSSFDRTGGNNDGFDGTYSCLRTSDTGGCVIAERSGPGQIESMWFTRDYGVMTKTGRIKVELDGVVVLDAPLQDVVDGKLGAPFVWPLVGNGDDTAGGSVIKVPMPYRQSMRITTQANPLFYHVAYREFADADGVRTFDPSDQAQDVIDRLRAYGLRDPKLPPASAVAAQQAATTVAGSWAVSLSGSGWINQIRVKIPSVVASPRVGDDGRAFGVGGSSVFRVAVDPRNQGVRITRRLDPQIGQQKARLLVDGQLAGTWDSGPAVPAGRWANQSIEIPAALTSGKSVLNLRNEFISSSLDINEFRYDIHSRVSGDWRRTDVMDIGPGHPGAEKAHGYAITNLNWQGYRVFRYPVDAGELSRSDAVLSGARLRVTFDGQTTVDAPIGEFFGSGLGEYDTRTLMSAMDTAPDGWYTSWWPMPFADSATVAVVNDSGVPIDDVNLEVGFAHDSSVVSGLDQGSLGYFHATHRPLAHTVNGQDWTFLETTGQGVFYGVTHTMRGDIPSGNRRNYLEGDERVYVDGARSPVMHGTGTEDFYESGWYFRDGTTYTMPLAGNPGYELDADGCPFDCTGAYRLMLGEAVSFSSSLSFSIEHGPANDAPANYSSTAYWYGRPGATLAETDLVDVSSDASRSSHGYVATGETRGSLQSTFEGRDDKTAVSRGVATATGPIQFTVSTTPGNDGVRLLRMSDQNTGYQRATVFVDGTAVGEWLQPLRNQRSRWLEDTFELPSSATAGKSRVTVRIVPSPGSAPWSGAQYRALSRG